MRLWRRKRNGSPTRFTMKRGNCLRPCISPWKQLPGTWPPPRVTSSRQPRTSWTKSRLTCADRSEEHTSELQSLAYLVCRLLLEKKKKTFAKSRTHYHPNPVRDTY